MCRKWKNTGYNNSFSLYEFLEKTLVCGLCIIIFSAMFWDLIYYPVQKLLFTENSISKNEIMVFDKNDYLLFDYEFNDNDFIKVVSKKEMENKIKLLKENELGLYRYDTYIQSLGDNVFFKNITQLNCRFKKRIISLNFNDNRYLVSITADELKNFLTIETDNNKKNNNIFYDFKKIFSIKKEVEIWVIITKPNASVLDEDRRTFKEKFKYALVTEYLYYDFPLKFINGYIYKICK